MIDLLKVPKTALAILAGLLDREAPADLPTPPRDVRDQLLWRLANNHLQPPPPAKKLDLRTLENSAVQWRD
jgi:hypothetical protein